MGVPDLERQISTRERRKGRRSAMDQALILVFCGLMAFVFVEAVLYTRLSDGPHAHHSHPVRLLRSFKGGLNSPLPHLLKYNLE